MTFKWWLNWLCGLKFETGRIFLFSCKKLRCNLLKFKNWSVALGPPPLLNGISNKKLRPWPWPRESATWSIKTCLFYKLVRNLNECNRRFNSTRGWISSAFKMPDRFRSFRLCVLFSCLFSLFLAWQLNCRERWNIKMLSIYFHI